MITACIISFLVGALIMFCAIGVVSNCKEEEPRNKVRFYVAKDKVGKLWLYLGKPVRDEVYETFMSNKYGCIMVTNSRFKYLGLNPDNFKNLKWEDEPIEVFLNLED